MEKLSIVLLALLLGACSKEKIQLNDQSPRITDLERRMLLNEQLDQVQSQLIQANSDALQTEAQARSDMDSYLLSLIQQESQARQSGDQDQANALSTSVSNQAAINASVQSQIDALNQSVSNNNSQISNLQSQINNLSSNLSTLESSVSSLSASVSSLDLRTSALESAQTSLQAQLNDLQAKTVQVFKCNSPTSTERVLKINGSFYAVNNHVTTQQVTVVTGTTSQTYTSIKLCSKDNDNKKFKLPGGNGQCPASYSLVPGSGQLITVPAYTTELRTVVDSVKIALEKLSDGNYTTTDNNPACNFSISNGGTSSTNLVTAQ